MKNEEIKINTPLAIDEIDFRVQSINKGGYATVLAYKDARADMQRLDDVYGVTGWQRLHTRDNHNCIVSIWCDDKKQWIQKEDTGTESSAEAQKGLASDSFKRACFNLGIGRELYDYPVIQIKLNSNEFKVEGGRAKQTWDLKLKEWIWLSEFVDNKLTSLIATDNNQNVRYSFSLNKVKAARSQPTKEVTKLTLASKTDPAYHKAIDYIKSGGKLSAIKSKYKLSKDIEAELKTL